MAVTPRRAIRISHPIARANPLWGVRDLTDVSDLAKRHGLALEETVAMPANNLSVIFRRA